MKKSLVAVALFGAFAAQAQAQSAVVIYGTLDAGVSKSTGRTTEIGARDNNKLGFMGTEDLGNGLKALFQLEMRYAPDTGLLEGGNTRPLFQGQSRVGLQGAFGTVRLGRGLTALQETSTRFEPWSGIPSKAGFQSDLMVAGYTSDPLSGNPSVNSRNRFSNALFYNTPVFAGFQANATVGTKEANGGNALVGTGTTFAPQFAANSEASAVPYSLSATYDNGPIAAMAAYERNAVETKLWSVAGSFKMMDALKLMASYQQQDQGETVIGGNDKTKAWVLGANYTMGPGKFLAGYGQKDPDGQPKTKQVSLGYEYSLSKRTYVYVDASNKKQAINFLTNVAAPRESVTSYGVGVHHNF